MGHAVLRLDLAFLHGLLQLPEDCKIVAVSSSVQNKTLELLIESSSLPEVADDQPYPYAHAICTVDLHPEDRDFRKTSVRIEVPVGIH